MFEQYARVPCVAQVEWPMPQVVQAEVLALTEEKEPGERSQPYGVKFSRFLEPVLRE